MVDIEDMEKLPDSFRKIRPEAKASTYLGKCLTLLIPLVIICATVYLFIVNFVNEETKYTISTESENLMGEQKLKLKCASNDGCLLSASFLGSEDHQNDATRCPRVDCKDLKGGEEIELSVCYSPDPIDGVTVSWASRAGPQNLLTVLGLRMEVDKLSSRHVSSPEWIALGFGEQLLTLGEVTKATGLGTVGPVQSWKAVTATADGIFNSDTLEINACKGKLIQSVGGGNEALLLSSDSPFRTAKLRVMPQKFVTVIKSIDALTFLSQLGGIANLFMAFGSLAVTAYLAVSSCRDKYKSAVHPTVIDTSISPR